MCKKGKIKLKEDPFSFWNNGCHHPVSETLYYPNSIQLYIRKYSNRRWTKAFIWGQGTEGQSFCEKINFPSSLQCQSVFLSILDTKETISLHLTKLWRVPLWYILKYVCFEKYPSSFLCNYINTRALVIWSKNTPCIHVTLSIELFTCLTFIFLQQRNGKEIITGKLNVMSLYMRHVQNLQSCSHNGNWD